MRRTTRHWTRFATLAITQLLGDGFDANMPAVVAIGKTPWTGAVDFTQGDELIQGKIGQVDGIGFAILAIVRRDVPFVGFEADMFPFGAQQFTDTTTGGKGKSAQQISKLVLDYSRWHRKMKLLSF